MQKLLISAVLVCLASVMFILAGCSGNRNRVYAILPGASNIGEYQLTIANNNIYWEPSAPVYQLQIFPKEKSIDQLFNNNSSGALWSKKVALEQSSLSLTAPIHLPDLLVAGNTYTIYLQAENGLNSQDGILVFKYVP